MDHVPKEVRSRIMASVKSSGGRTTEKALSLRLRAAGLLGYRKQWAVLGKPDFAWPGLKVAVFVDGCFWHGCKKHCRIPEDNKQYWRGKIARNVRRDKATVHHLRKLGWQIFRIWEHSLKEPIRIAGRIRSRLSKKR